MARTESSLFIGGEWLSSPAMTMSEIINPATEEVIGHAPIGGTKEVGQAISAAREAFDHGPWPGMSMKARVAVMERFHEELARRQKEIVSLIIAEAGATRLMAGFLQFGVPMKHASHILEEALRIQPESTPYEISFAQGGGKVFGSAVTVFDPVGVVAAITPYNFPFYLNVVKVFHALTMGNSIVLKPSPFTPLEALILGEAAHAAGLPPGVLNIVTGDVDTGKMMTTDPRIDMISFTGSDTVGASIMAQAAPTLKKIHLELGGKSALIVRADADIKKAAQDGLGGFTIHCGQGCALTTRLLVHNSVRRQYVDTLIAMIKHLKIGNPADPSVNFGPLIREQARKRSEHYVAEGVASGATLVVGGKRPAGLERGFFFEPTLFDDVDNRSRLAQEEIFGPIGAVIGFDTDEEAIALANDSKYGLSGGIYSADTGRAFELALQVRTGGIAINGGGGTMLSGAPFGGIKRSGIGREDGRLGLLEFTTPKSISFHAG